MGAPDGQSPGAGRGPADRVVALVLAAGASSRMGRPKALLEFDGPLCLDLVVQSCSEGGTSAIVLVTSPAGDALRQRVPTAIQAVNDRPERGMLTSIQAGLRLLPPDAAAFLIFPVDYPLVPADEVRRLRLAFAAGGGAVFVPSYARRRGHPVLMDARLAPELLALPETESARTVLAAHEHELVHVAASDDRVLLDMDTPEDYQRCLTRHRQGA
jgi:molybdenum cofactor cytidylyltransferase